MPLVENWLSKMVSLDNNWFSSALDLPQISTTLNNWSNQPKLKVLGSYFCESHQSVSYYGRNKDGSPLCHAHSPICGFGNFFLEDSCSCCSVQTASVWKEHFSLGSLAFLPFLCLIAIWYGFSPGKLHGLVQCWSNSQYEPLQLAWTHAWSDRAALGNLGLISGLCSELIEGMDNSCKKCPLRGEREREREQLHVNRCLLCSD